MAALSDDALLEILVRALHHLAQWDPDNQLGKITVCWAWALQDLDYQEEYEKVIAQEKNSFQHRLKFIMDIKLNAR